MISLQNINILSDAHIIGQAEGYRTICLPTIAKITEISHECSKLLKREIFTCNFLSLQEFGADEFSIKKRLITVIMNKTTMG